MKHGDNVPVLFVRKSDAKRTKIELEVRGMLNKDYKISETRSKNVGTNCVAVPLLESEVSENTISSILSALMIESRGFGIQYCSYSTSMLGNQNKIKQSILSTKKSSPPLTLVQSGIIKAFATFWDNYDGENEKNNSIYTALETKLLELDLGTCPKTLQYLGDDRTLVIPLRAFDIDRCAAFHQLISFGINQNNLRSNKEVVSCEKFIAEYLWTGLATVYNSHRVVRRGEIDPDSHIRLSEYKILWFDPKQYSETTQSVPGSVGWITVTEQGIRQSFDLTKVMFSRGNITEKIRFGELVQVT